MAHVVAQRLEGHALATQFAYGIAVPTKAEREQLARSLRGGGSSKFIKRWYAKQRGVLATALAEAEAEPEEVLPRDAALGQGGREDAGWHLWCQGGRLPGDALRGRSQGLAQQRSGWWQ